MELIRVERERAALVMQNSIRCFISRKKMERVRLVALQNKSATLLQRAYRGYEGRVMAQDVMQSLREERATLMIQNCFRGYKGKMHFLDVWHERETSNSASKIQALFRGKGSREKTAVILQQKREARAATKIQCQLRGKKERAFLLQQKGERIAVVLLQTKIRAFLQKTAFKRTVAREKQRKYMERLNFAALRVQTRYRVHHDKLSYHLKLRAIQAEEELQREIEAMSAIRVQSLIRGRNAYRSTKGRADQLDAERQEARTKKALADRAKYEKSCALTIQSWWRAQTAKQTFRFVKVARLSLMEEHEPHVLKIQSVWRGFHCRSSLMKRRDVARNTEEEGKLMDDSASTMQRAYRNCRRKKQHAETAEKALLRKKEEESVACVRIQSVWRGKINMQTSNLSDSHVTPKPPRYRQRC
jgi:hypothetical protein